MIRSSFSWRRTVTGVSLLAVLAFFVLAGAFGVTPAAAQGANNGLQFDGNDRVRITDVSNVTFGAGDSFTIEFWARIDSLAVDNVLVANRQWAGSNVNYYVEVLTSGAIQIGWDDGGNTATFQTAPVIGLSNWNHFAAVWNGSTAAIYLNGAAQAVSGSASGSPDGTAGGYELRFSGTAFPIRGALDEVRIWNTARSAAQISAAQGSCVAPDSSGLAGYWHLDAGADPQVAYDVANGANGQLGDTPGVDSADPTPVNTAPTRYAFCDPTIDTVVVVSNDTPNNWAFLLETGTTGVGQFVDGPDTPPSGMGSVNLQTPASADGMLIGKLDYAGTYLRDISRLEYSTYRTAGASEPAIALQFNIDYDLTDSNTGWQGRLVYEPYYSQTVNTGQWQTWDALADVGDGNWWGSGAVVAAVCPISNPCTWSEVLANFPNSGIHADPTLGAVLLKAGSAWAGFNGSADWLVLGIDGDVTAYDFELVSCTTVCYADAVNGDDSFSGLASAPKRSIQAAIDAVQAGGQVRVLPGSYAEVATGRMVFGAGGPHQFGLYIGPDKAGITVMGVDSGDTPITDPYAVQAFITTNATNTFGYSGVFVEGNDVTLQGLSFGDNTPYNNKTIEVIGDGFVLRYANFDTSDSGAVYISDFRSTFDVVQRYTIADNVFDDGTQIAISSGAGAFGPVSGRVISGNYFDIPDSVVALYGAYPPVSFNGAGGVPWFTYPVGGALITGNTFAPEEQYIRARGTYTEAEFDWESYWNDNSYQKAVVTLEDLPTFAVRAYSYTSGPYTLTNVRRIGGVIQPQVDIAAAGDTVLVAAGVYPENVEIDRSLTITSEDPGDLTCATPGPGANAPVLDGSGFPASGDNNGFDLAAGVTDVTIQGFEIRNYSSTFSGVGNGVRAWNSGTANITVRNNYIHDVSWNYVLVGNEAQGVHSNWTVTCNIGENGDIYGVELTNTRDSAITNNILSDGESQITLTAQGNPAVTAENILIQGNTLSSANRANLLLVTYDYGSSSGAQILRDVTIDANTISNNGRAIEAFSVGSGQVADLTISGNLFTITDPLGSGDALGLTDIRGSSLVQGNNYSISGTIGGGGTFFHFLDLEGSQTGSFVVTQNTLNGSGIGSLSVGIRLRSSLPATAVIDVTFNSITGFANGVRADALPAGLDANINQNNLVNNTVNGILNGAGVLLDGTVNWWGDASGPSGAGPGTGSDAVSTNVSFCPWLNGPFDSGGAVAGPVRNLDTNEVFCTIQAAIDDPDTLDGHTIEVNPGTYAENVVVNKNVTLQGANAGVCANNPAELSALNPARGAETFVNPASGTAFTIDPTSDNVTIDGFAVTAPIDYGVYAWNAAAPGFENITITNNRFEGLAGWGVMSGGADRSDWRISCNRFDGWSGTDKTAVWLAGNANSGLELSYNFVRGSTGVAGSRGFIVDGAVNTTIQFNEITSLTRYGVQLTNSADTVLVANNDLSNMQVGVQLLTSASGATGILDNVTVQDNTIGDVTAIAIWLANATTGGPGPGTVNNLLITGNTVIQNVGMLTSNFALIDLRFDPAASGAHGLVTISNNDVTFNGSFGSATAAYAMQVRGKAGTVNITGNSLDGGGVGGSATNPATAGLFVRVNDSAFGLLPATAEITVTFNTFTGFQNGVTVYDPVAGTYGELPAGAALNINRNSIDGNPVAGVIAGAGGEQVDGTCNWWGAADGPAPLGGGDSAVGNVDYIPFLLSSDLNGDCTDVPPLAVDDSGQAPFGVPVTVDVLGNDSGIGISVFSVSAGANQSVVNNGDGTVTYTRTGGLNAGQVIFDTFTYTIRDAEGRASTATVTVEVARLNLTSMCPPGEFRVRNPGSFDITYRWQVETSGTPSADLIAPPGDSFFNTGVGSGTVIITMPNGVQHNTKATLRNCVQVDKVVDWGEFTPDPAQTFDICLVGPQTYCQSFDSDGGAHTFQNIAPGTYTVTETPGSAWDVTLDPPTLTVEDGQLSTYAVTVTNSYNPKGAIGVFKFDDRNRNGSKDRNERGLHGWEFVVKDLDGNIVAGPLLTDADGNLLFPDLPIGTYQVCEILQDGWLPTSGELCQTVVVTQDTTTPVSFANYRAGSVRVNKYDDINGDGSRQSGEPVLIGWTFTLSSAGGYSQELTTGSSGRVDFTNLVPGPYILCETAREGWQPVSGDNCRTVTVTSGQRTTVNVFNEPRDQRERGEVCVPFNFTAGQMVEGQYIGGLVQVSTSNGQTIYAAPGQNPFGWDSSPKNFPGGLIDRTRVHDYSFTFAPEIIVTTFSVRVVDWGDYNPAHATEWGVQLVGTGTGVGPADGLVFSTTANGTLPSGIANASSAPDGQPGNRRYAVTGSELTGAELNFSQNGSSSYTASQAGAVSGATSADPHIGLSELCLTYRQRETEVTVNKEARTDGSPQVGEQVIYEVLLNNEGSYDAQNVVMTDVLPAAVAFVSAEVPGGVCSYDADTHTVTCTLAVLGAGDEAEVVITVTLTAAGDVLNEACASSDNSAPDCDDASITAAPLVGSLTVTKVVETYGYDVGGEFEICVSGNGLPEPLCQTTMGGMLTFDDLLPGEYSISESDPGAAWTVDPANRTLTAVVSAGSTVDTGTITNFYNPPASETCAAAEVRLYQPGLGDGSNPQPALNRQVTANALGIPQNNDSSSAPINFVSLGRGGVIELRLDGAVYDDAGIDLFFVETSYGSPTCGSYPERANIYVSQTGAPGTWVLVGNVCTDGGVDFNGAIAWAGYVRMEDFTSFNSDGYDLDGIACQQPPAQPGSIRVTKYNDVNGSGSRQSDTEPVLSGWTFNVYQGQTLVAGPQTTGANGQTTFGSLAPGQYQVCEVQQSAWRNTDPSNGSGCKTVTVQPNGTANVSFGNQLRTASISIEKDAVQNFNENEFVDFAFLDYNSVAFILDDDSDGAYPNFREFSGLTPDVPYTFSEQSYQNSGGYGLYSVVCTAADQSAVNYSVTGGSVSVTPAPGQDITCVFTNKRLPTLFGLKYNDLDGSGTRDDGEPLLGGWTLTLYDAQNNPVGNPVVTSADGTVSFGAVQPGTYTVCETFQDGWTNTDPNSGSGCKTATVGYLGGWTFVFGNQQDIPAPVLDIEERCGANGAEFRIVNNGGPMPAPESYTLDGGTPVSFQLDAGAATDWINAGYGAHTLVIGADLLSSSLTCAAPVGSLQITKAVVGEGAPQDASFTICVSGPAFAQPDCQSYTAGQTRTYSNLTPGSYTVSEQDAGADWTEPAAQEVSVTADQTVYVTVTNSYTPPPPPQYGSLTINKRVQTGLPVGFPICITGPSYPGGDCQTIIPGNPYTWTNLLVGTYTVSEPTLAQGWSIVSGTGDVQVVANQTTSVLVVNRYDEPGAVCPQGYSQMALNSTWASINKQGPVEVTLALNLPAATAGYIAGISRVGHPDYNCPYSGNSRCTDQQNEEFNILVDGQFYGFVPDHGNNQILPFPALPSIQLPAGPHSVTFRHTLVAGNNPYDSVDFIAVYCYVEAPPPAPANNEQPPVEQPPVEQPPAEQQAVEQPAAVVPPAEEPPVDEPPVEEPPADEQPPVEQPPAEGEGG